MVLVTSEKHVCGFIEFELIKLAERINVSGNMTDSQIEFIAGQLLGMYPNETIADFKICFERAAVGHYNGPGEKDIFRLDGIIVCRWMQQYLDEKYQVLENQLMKEKDEMYKKPLENTDWLQLWKEAVEKSASEGEIKTTSQNLTYLNNIRGMSDKEIKEQGQPKPKKSEYIPDPTRIADYKKKLRIAREIAIRKKYPELTDEKVSELIANMPEL